MAQELAVYEKPMDIASVRRQVNLVQEVMKEFMKEDEHYGIIPGCKKKSLYKAGAEKLCMVFHMDPRYDVQITNMVNGHREVTVTCTLYTIGSEIRLGSGVGSASTMEVKYRFRDMQRTCPACGQETIIKGREEYGGGWLCFAKKGGCGAKFEKDDPAIREQIVGKVEYDNPADFFNTVLKMAKKRAHTDAVLTVTATSDIFAQDIKPEPDDEPFSNGPLSDPVAEAELKKGALSRFDQLFAEKNPTAAQKSLLPKFLALYKEPEDQVKAQAAGAFEDFWGWFIGYCVKNAEKAPKTSKKNPTQSPDPSPEGGVAGENGPVAGITADQLTDLRKVPADLLADAFMECQIDRMDLKELDEKSAAVLVAWLAKV